MKRFAILSTATLLVGMVAAAAQAATITWGAATTMSGESDVVTDGMGLHAYAINATTVNGVNFTTGWTKATSGSLTATNGQDTFTVSGNYLNIYGAPTFLTGPASNNYDTLTGGAIYKDSAGTATYTLGGLTAGCDYLVQIWSRDARYFAGYTEKCMATVDNAVTLDYNVTNTAGGMGQYTVGRFTADAETQTFTLVGAECPVQLNGMQLRDVTVPEPGTMALLAAAALGLVAYAWRKRK